MSKVRELMRREKSYGHHLVDIDELTHAVEADETEAAKATTAMPDDVREVVKTLRRPSHITSAQQESLVAFLDAAFPEPLPQWELDARWVEKIARGMVPEDKEHETMLIAERIREANRGK